MKITFRNLNYSILLIGVFFILTESCKKSDDDQGGETKSGIVKDIEGNVYHTDTIGEQIWMTENLKTTKYRDGSPIPKVNNSNTWQSLTTGAYCNCNNDPVIGSKYGKLYNWYAVSDIHNIAPEGWHVATDDEWKVLEEYVAGNPGVFGSVAKAFAANTEWNPSEVADAIGNDLTKNNSSGFTAFPGGNRTNDGEFGFNGYEGGWWSSSESYTYNAWARTLSYDSYRLETGSYGKKCGFYVRCVKD
jgi:uncharacterized protein (TIGR02145 family)